MATKTSTIVIKSILYITGMIILIMGGIVLTDYISPSEGVQSLLQKNFEYKEIDFLLIIFNYIDSNYSDPMNTALKLAVQSFFSSGSGFTLPSYLNFLPFVFYILAGALGILLIISIIRKVREKTRVSKTKNVSFGSVYQSALLTIVFIFTLIPLFSPVIDQGTNDQNFSVYNDDWNGCSTFKETLELMGYDVMTIQSSLSATERLEQLQTLNYLKKSVLLVMLGPNRFYNPIYEVPFFIDFFKGKNSLLLCHDHGSTYELLWEIFAANKLEPSDTTTNSTLLNNTVNDMPVTIFADGYLRDNKSFELNPLFPVIKRSQFNDPENIFTEGIDQVILSRATAAAGGPLLDFFGWNVVAETSDVHSFVDKNYDGRYDYKFTVNNLTYYNDAIDINFVFDMILKYYDLSGQSMPTELVELWNETQGHLPLGYPFTPAVFLSKDMDNFRTFVSSDASLWNNQLILHPKYDNLQLALNVVNWLTRQDEGDLKNQWVIAIDEAHVRPETTSDMSSAGIFGLVMRYIIQLSTNPITAWIYPLLAVVLLRKFLPRKRKEEEQKQIKKQEKRENKLRFRTSSFFSKKINMYHEKRRYRKATLLLYRRLERKLHAQLGSKPITPQNVVNLVRTKDPNVSKNKLKRIGKFIQFISQLQTRRKNVRDKDTFETLYFELTWVNSNL
jgi:hypothetical protein